MTLLNSVSEVDLAPTGDSNPNVKLARRLLKTSYEKVSQFYGFMEERCKFYSAYPTLLFFLNPISFSYYLARILENHKIIGFIKLL